MLLAAGEEDLGLAAISSSFLRNICICVRNSCIHDDSESHHNNYYVSTSLYKFGHLFKKKKNTWLLYYNLYYRQAGFIESAGVIIIKGIEPQGCDYCTFMYLLLVIDSG